MCTVKFRKGRCLIFWILNKENFTSLISSIHVMADSRFFLFLTTLLLHVKVEEYNRGGPGKGLGRTLGGELLACKREPNNTVGTYCGSKDRRFIEH